jgi:8-oxo-dGTP diphosphatase
MTHLHPTQISLLQKLMYSNGLKFSQLKPKDSESNKFTFHLEKLISEDLIKKNSNLYQLTETGKELAGRMDLGDSVIKNQAKISVVMVCINTVNSPKKYLLYTRLKSPFYKYQGFPTGKVQEGETIVNAATRELKEETGLTGKPQILGILHSTIKNPSQKLLEDKIFFICKFLNPEGKLINGPEGEYQWVNQDQINEYLQKPVQEIKDIIKMLKTDDISFEENTYTVTNI